MNKQATPICILFVLLGLSAFSQSYTHMYYLDESLNSVAKNKAIITGKGYYDQSSFKLDCYAGETDILILSLHFVDTSLGSLEGLFQQYHDGKNLESQGYYQNNKKQGIWEDWNKEGQKTDSAFYDKGIRLRYAKYTYFSNYNKKNNGIYCYEFTDSLANTLNTRFFSDSGTVAGEVKFIGEKGVWTHFNKDGNTIDSVYTRDENEAEFPGGNQGWARYLERTMGTFNPGENGAGNGKWQVIVKFIVSEDGTISEVEPETHFGHKMEETVVRVISKGPKWVPAKQYGRPVKAYRRQPVTFIVEGQ